MSRFKFLAILYIERESREPFFANNESENSQYLFCLLAASEAKLANVGDDEKFI